MNHQFNPRALCPSQCSICKRSNLDHTDEALCECCDYVGKCEIYCATLMCPNCIDNEKALQSDNMTEAKQNIRASDSLITTLEGARNVTAAVDIDNSIQVRTDLFNAHTVSIASLKTAIDTEGYDTWHEKNTSQSTKFELALRLSDRFKHLTQVIFQKKNELTAIANEQKAIQVQLNQLANKLRHDERSAIKLKDINYKPAAPKKIGIPKIKKRKFSKSDLRKLSAEIGIPTYTIEVMAVQKNISLEAVGELLKEMMNASDKMKDTSPDTTTE